MEAQLLHSLLILKLLILRVYQDQDHYLTSSKNLKVYMISVNFTQLMKLDVRCESSDFDHRILKEHILCLNDPRATQ